MTQAEPNDIVHTKKEPRATMSCGDTGGLN